MNRLTQIKHPYMIVLITLLTLGLVTCNSHRPRHTGNTTHVMKKVTKKLDLSYEQQGKLKVVINSMDDFHGNLKENRDNFSSRLKSNLAQPDLDLEQLNAHFDEFEIELRQFRTDALTKYADFHASLNDDQRAELVATIEKFEERHRD